MKFFNIFRNRARNAETGRFAEFFRTATPKEKIKVFTKAAQLANEDQRKVLKEIIAK